MILSLIKKCEPALYESKLLVEYTNCASHFKEPDFLPEWCKYCSWAINTIA
jgi:hypothetical protein